MKKLLVLLALFALPLSASTRKNDDTCDIAQMPAATLLLPYFELDLGAPRGVARTTLISVTNVTARPQVAHVTLWTDWAFPVLGFNIQLTGYDTQSFDLRDVFDGALPSTANPPRGSRSDTTNPNLRQNAAGACNVQSQLPVSVTSDLRSAFTNGTFASCGATKVGSLHAASIAAGYVTIDVVATCTLALPTQNEYYLHLLYDNVLTGDAIEVSPNSTTGNYAGASPLVHIRAIPEGGAAGDLVSTNLPRTFYGSYVAANADRRQPLPARFMARYIEGGATGFNTAISTWRSGTPARSCADAVQNSRLRIGNVVRFDERENPAVLLQICCFEPLPPLYLETPAASRHLTSGTFFPPLVTGDVAGWMYLDLDTYESTIPAQGWATVTMSAEGRYSTVHDATPFGNGCSPQSTTPSEITPAP